jgi:hypothetical protein
VIKPDSPAFVAAEARAASMLDDIRRVVPVRLE